MAMAKAKLTKSEQRIVDAIKDELHKMELQRMWNNLPTEAKAMFDLNKIMDVLNG